MNRGAHVERGRSGHHRLPQRQEHRSVGAGLDDLAIGGQMLAEPPVNPLAGLPENSVPKFPGGRTAIPASRRYPAAVSRRTPRAGRRLQMGWIRQVYERPKQARVCM